MVTSFGLACAPARPDVSRPTHGSFLAIVMAAGSACTPNQRPLHAVMRASADSTVKAFTAWGAKATVVDVRTRADVLRVLDAAAQGPTLVVYSGHGSLVEGTFPRPLATPTRLHVRPRHLADCPERGPPCLSVICLENEVMAVDELLEALPPGPFPGTLLVDACFSAHADPRRSPGPAGAAVISMSPHPLYGDVDQTLAARAIVHISAGELDGDCDGMVSDLELFDQLNRHIPVTPAFDAVPKYRRNVFGPHRLFAAPRTPNCVPARLPSREPDRWEVRCARNSGVDSLIVRGSLTRETSLPLNQRVYAADDLVALPCDDDVGQCFRSHGGMQCFE